MRTREDRRLRVVTLIDNPDITGGGERMAVTIALRLDPTRFDRTLCATREVPGPKFDLELREAGTRVISLERRSRADLSAWWPLVSLLRRERVDILHAHKFGSNVWGTVIGRLARVPIVIAHEQTWGPAEFSAVGQSFRAVMDREVIGRGVDLFFAVSRADQRRMIQLEGVDGRRICVLPNAVPPVRPTRHDVRAELRIPQGAAVVGTVCQLRPQKALDLLVSAAGHLRPEFPDLRVLIAGDGAERGQLEQQIQADGLEETVLLLGTRTDVPDVIAAFDVAVCCSNYEGTPLSVMEYMGTGKPVVATRVGGVPELIEHGVHGLLCEVGDVAGLAGAVAELLRDPERRARMGERGRARQGQEFDLDTAVRRVEELYELLYLRTERARREGWTPLPLGTGASR
jgi:glycosyltransferase involved in cell wall biosynthesis